MAYDPQRHHRRSIRLKEYDYRNAGAYFVTICTRGRCCHFGEILDGQLMLSAAGRMIDSTWRALPDRFPILHPDTFIVMPNHVHGIVVIAGDARRSEPCIHTRSPAGTAPDSLGRIMQAFKSLTTTQYIRCVKQAGWPRFEGTLWQRDYYEHVVRNEQSLHRIREYIEANPSRWETDEENPVGTGNDSLDEFLQDFL